MRRSTVPDAGLDLFRDAFEPDPAPDRRSGAARLVRAAGASALLGTALALLFLPAAAAAGIGAREASRAWLEMPSELPEQRLPQQTVVLAADGSRIATLFSENRVPVPLDRVPRTVVDAVLAIEDARFYDHHGVDPKGILRAALNNRAGGPRQGGSTITQQYVKNVLLASARTPEQREAAAGTSLSRKLREARLAMAVEGRMSKDEILEGYLNAAYFSDGAYGIGTAARHFFGVPVEDLTVAQAALLAGTVKNPAAYDPVRHPEAAQARRDLVLGRMLDLKMISPEQAATARSAPLGLRLTSTPNGCTTSPYPFFCTWVKQQMETDPAFGATPEARRERIFLGGMVVRTTLDPAAQKAAQAAVDRALPADSRVAAALATVRPGTGHVAALATNRRFGKGPGQTEVLLPAVPAFQPGSTFKAFTLATALEQGIPPGLTLVAPDRYSPPGRNAPPGGFGNAAEGEAGTYDAHRAMWHSVNTWFVKLQHRTGVVPVADLAGRLGITSLPRTGPRAITEADASLTLGAYEVSPLEMAGAYAAFAANGVHCRPVGIARVDEPGGTRLPGQDARCAQAVTPAVAATVADVLTGVIDGPDPSRTGARATLGRPAAGKTGTTNDYGAAWFTGFTPDLATAVWVGDPRGPKYRLVNVRAYGTTFPRVFGGTIPAPIWADAMKAMHTGLPVRPLPGPDALGSAAVPLVVPDVAGLTAAQAARLIAGAGLVPKVDDGLPLPAGLPPGRAVGTVPAAGAPVAPGTSVTVRVAGKAEPFRLG